MKHTLFSHQNQNEKYNILFRHAEGKDIPSRLGRGLRTTSELPFRLVSHVSNKVHNVLESGAAKIHPTLSYLPTASKNIVHRTLKTGQSIVGGTVETATKGVAGLGVGAAKTIKEGGQSLAGSDKNLSKTEQKDLLHGDKVRKQARKNRKKKTKKTHKK